jgi:hypothetical protein
MIGLIVVLAVFTADGDNVIDLIGRDVLTESKAASDLDLVGVMADVLVTGYDDKGFERRACDEFCAGL